MPTTHGEFANYLRSLGFVEYKLNRRGSHNKIMRHLDGRFVRICSPNSKSLGIGLLRDLCEQANIDFAAAKEAVWS